MSMVSPDYAAFLASKAPRTVPCGIDPAPMAHALADFQQDVTGFSLRAGRAALFLDTGLGKSLCQMEWCEQAAIETRRPSLILAPFIVAKQFEREAAKFGYDVNVIRDQAEARPGLNVCNYDRLHLIDPAAYGAVSLDESGILKSFTGKTTRALTEAFAETRFRLCATATPAPNDHMELGQHAEFLGIMKSQEMLARWFINDTSQASQQWRLKRAAVNDFWGWVASWARCAETPADLGYDGSAYVLPPLNVIRHQAFGDLRPAAGALFFEDLSATNIHDVKRQTASARADAVAALVQAESNEPWLIWCDTDYESSALAARIPDAIELRGSMSPDAKEAAIEAFLDGNRSLITKPSIAGRGPNFQHCARLAYVGRSFSYESFYQSVRRAWRFGQKRPVDVHLIVAEGEDQIGRVIDRKAEDHRAMKRAMADAMRRSVAIRKHASVKYEPHHIGRLPVWMKSVA